MYIEEDARTKWCPFARLSSSNSPEVGNHAANRWPGDEPHNRVPKAALCIASGCMAWRWGVPDHLIGYSATPDVKPPVPKAGWEPYGDVYETTKDLPKIHREAGEKQYAQPFVKRTGYCGLAGKP